MYYNARYYDPALGMFVSPDTLIPNPGQVVDYNRYAYARLNPMGFNDPTGHWPESPWQPISDFGYGAASAWGYNNSWVSPAYQERFAAQDGESTATTVGRLAGDVASMVQGVAEVGGGTTLGGGGVAACATGVGCLAGAPAIAAGGATIAHGGGVATAGAVGAGQRLGDLWLMATGGGKGSSSITNNAGDKYPSVRVRGYGKVPYPKGEITKTNPSSMRAQFTQELRIEFRQFWHDKHGWYPSPDKYDIHHIKPLSRGGTNDFGNLVPLKRGAEHNQFTNWWIHYP